MQKIQKALLPFDSKHETIEVPEGLSIKGMLEVAFPHKVDGLKVIVLMGNEQVPEENWHKIYPKQETLVTFNIVPTGGKGGKNPLGFILSIAAVVVAPYIAPAAFAAVAAGTATFGQMLTVAAVRIGLGMVASLASSMLASTPSQPRNGSKNIAESPTQFIQGATNAINRYGVIPVNLGTNRMFPPQAALPYTETSGNNQYVRQLFTYGFGDLVISEEQIGETSIYEYSGVEIEYRLEGNLNEPTDIYTTDVFQEGLSVTLNQADVAGATIRNTQPGSTEAEIDITFTQGLTVYDKQGNRQRKTVQFEIVFALDGTDDWSTGNTGKSFPSQSLTIPESSIRRLGGYTTIINAGGVLALNLSTGVVKAYTQSSTYSSLTYPSVGEGYIRIGSWSVSFDSSDIPTYNFIDERAAISASYFNSPLDFAISTIGRNVTIASGTVISKIFTVSNATAQPLRTSYRMTFPEAGEYKVRVRRLTADAPDEKTRDLATLTALRSFNPINPVLQPDVSGKAVRMLATDQLNGSVDRLNDIVSTKLYYYDSDEDAWLYNVSSNPAAIFRYVLQSPAFAKRLPDERIDLEKLEEWSIYCDLKGFTYNNVVDYNTSVDDLLDDICAAGMATKSKINGVYSVIIDNERPIIKGLVTPRNSWGYSANMNYPEIPHALLVQFRNQDKGFIVDERVVYSDGYDSSNATLFETLEFKSCTNADLAYYYGRRYIATALLQREIHIFNQDFENLTYSRGDRISFVNDSILVGVGQGRIKSLVYDSEISPTQITGFVVDEEINVPSITNFGTRVRYSDASDFAWHGLVNVPGLQNTFTLSTPVDIVSVESAEDTWLGSLCSFTQFGNELDLIVTDIRMNKDQSAKITCTNYAPERFEVDEGTIPPFESNIIIPVEMTAPLPPELVGNIVSDETVMSKNADGSYVSRMVINLNNRNDESVRVLTQIRVTGATEWGRPDLLVETPQTIVITGLQNDQRYDIRVRYQRPETSYFSQPLSLNNVRFVGTTSLPPDVEQFRVAVSNNTGLFEWEPVDAIDVAYYEIRFTRLTTGVSWSNAQPVSQFIEGNRVSLPIQSGTYLIKAFDIDENESVNATTIQSIDDGAFKNVVEFLQQQPDWNGTFDNTQVIDDDLYLVDTSQIGYYYFDPDPLDLTEVYENRISFAIEAYGSVYNKIRSVASIRAISSIRDIVGTSTTGSAKIRVVPNIRSILSMRGIEEGSWSVNLEMNLSNDNITWTGWIPAQTGSHIFRYARFRLVLQSFQTDISPQVVRAEATVDMPERYESGDDVLCPATGVTITYDAVFKRNPSVNITVQDGAVDDRIEYVSKDETGFTIKIYNATIGDYVERTFDYVSAGYGRVI